MFFLEVIDHIFLWVFILQNLTESFVEFFHFTFENFLGTRCGSFGFLKSITNSLGVQSLMMQMLEVRVERSNFTNKIPDH